MGLLQRAALAEHRHSMIKGMTSNEYASAFFNGEPVPEPWLGSRMGGLVSPEVALTLSYVYSAALIISDDFGTMTCQGFENIGPDAKQRIKFSDPSIGSLARKLRWAPNSWQTAKEFWSTIAWQVLLRPIGYAEIIYRKGLNGFVEAIVPRHPDRVRQEILDNGSIRFKLLGEPNGPRYVTQEEMMVFRNTSTDGIHALGKLDYGARDISTGLALQEFTNNWFKKGATAALVATYKGEQDDENEVDIHNSLMRYMSGAQNAGGVLVIPQDLDIKALGVDPEKSQLIELKGLSGRDVARLFKMPPSWLGIEGASAYNSQVQDATNYVNRCQVPMAVAFEQIIQRDLVIAQDRYFFKFNMDYLLRADFLARMQGYEVGIRARVLRPSEARIREDMNPDPELDQLSAKDRQPGQAPTGGQQGPPDNQKAPGEPPPAGKATPAKAEATVRESLETVASAVACVRKERAILVRLAQKHASDSAGYTAAVSAFYRTHAGEVSEAMNLPPAAARAYCERHEAAVGSGIVLIDGAGGDKWQNAEAAELAILAMG